MLLFVLSLLSTLVGAQRFFDYGYGPGVFGDSGFGFGFFDDLCVKYGDFFEFFILFNYLISDCPTK